MPLILGFHIQYTLNPLGIHFSAAKVSLWLLQFYLKSSQRPVRCAAQQYAASPRRLRRPVSNEVMSVNALLKLEKSMT